MRMRVLKAQELLDCFFFGTGKVIAKETSGRLQIKKPSSFNYLFFRKYGDVASEKVLSRLPRKICLAEDSSMFTRAFGDRIRHPCERLNVLAGNAWQL
jgi:hypothetical protein